jgi:hypothetical protein
MEQPNRQIYTHIFPTRYQTLSKSLKKLLIAETNTMHIEQLRFSNLNICIHKNVQTTFNPKLDLLNEQDTLYSFVFPKKLQNKADCVLIISDILP